MRAKIYVSLKNGVLDPQGNAVSELIKSKNISGISNIRQGKYFEVNLETNNEEEAKKLVDLICRDFLANGVIENYEFELLN